MNKNKIKLTAVGICALAIVAMGSWCVYQYKNYLEVKRHWTQKTQDAKVLKQEIADIQNSLERFEQEKQEFSQLLFQERDIPAFLDQIAKFAKDHQVNISDMQTQKFYQVQVPEDVAKSRALAGYTPNKQSTSQELEQILTLAAMPIQIRVDGTFESLVKFLDVLQDSRQLLNISKIRINVTMDYPKLDCQFTLSIYSLKTLKESKIL